MNKYFFYTTQKKKKWKLIKMHIFLMFFTFDLHDVLIIEKSLRVVLFLYIKPLWYFWFFA